jgi:pyridoxamine 5'-phosphate oxidase
MALDRLAQMRVSYADRGLSKRDAGADPLALFSTWLNNAVEAEIAEPNAMALATADESGAPSVRIVLLKKLDEAGAVFYTNYASRKGTEIASNPRAAAVMLWHDLGRQVRFEGKVEPVSDAESDAYFASRPFGSQVSAASSPQSHPVDSRGSLEELREELREDVREGTAANQLERPSQWGGFRIIIDQFEFWQGRPDRLHDRIRFVRAGSKWMVDRLAP